MGKLEDEVAKLKEEVAAIKTDISQMNFNILRILSELSKITGEGFTPAGSSPESNQISVASAVDLGPVEERLEELTKRLITKDEIELLAEKIDKMASERIKDAEETIKRVTGFLQTGLEMVKIEATLSDVKSLLEETIIKSS